MYLKSYFRILLASPSCSEVHLFACNAVWTMFSYTQGQLPGSIPHRTRC